MRVPDGQNAEVTVEMDPVQRAPNFAGLSEPRPFVEVAADKSQSSLGPDKLLTRVACHGHLRHDEMNTGEADKLLVVE